MMLPKQGGFITLFIKRFSGQFKAAMVVTGILLLNACANLETQDERNHKNSQFIPDKYPCWRGPTAVSHRIKQ